MIKCSQIAYPETISMEEYLERFFEIREENADSVEYEENYEEEACSYEQALFYKKLFLLHVFVYQRDCIKQYR